MMEPLENTSENSPTLTFHNMLKFLVKKFFNIFYKYRPPEQVHYWKEKDATKAKLITRKDGSVGMLLDGEKREYPGFPRGHVLTGPLAKLKHKVKNRVFNEVFKEISGMWDGMKYDAIPPEKMPVAVRELYRCFEELENAEVVPDMKARIRLIRNVMCFFLTEDDAYRFRMQWMLPKLDMKKIKLSKEDKYYFRGKYFKVDHDHYDY